VRNNRSREREIGRSKQVTKEKGTWINFDPDQNRKVHLRTLTIITEISDPYFP
jgi:hypothetical protein